MKILILYYSKTGHTQEAVNATAEGIRSAGSEAKPVSVRRFNEGMLAECDGVILGSPCWAGSVTGAGIARPLAQVLKTLPAGCLQNKRCGAISVHSAVGGANTVRALGKVAAGKGCTDFRPGFAAKAGLPFSRWKGRPVSARDEERYKAYGSAFVA